MPSCSYNRFLKNLETVTRLQESYDIIRRNRGSRGKGAFDHITRSAVLFLASAFEVYIEEITAESCEVNISKSRNAVNLPHDVRSSLNDYTRREKQPISPINLCDEGWRDVYRQMVQEEIAKLNTPKVHNIISLFTKYIGLSESEINHIPNIDKLDPFVSFRGEITHRVKANSYVQIEDVIQNKDMVENLVKETDKLILSFFHRTYPSARVPWNNTY